MSSCSVCTADLEQNDDTLPFLDPSASSPCPSVSLCSVGWVFSRVSSSGASWLTSMPSAPLHFPGRGLGVWFVPLGTSHICQFGGWVSGPVGPLSLRTWPEICRRHAIVIPASVFLVSLGILPSDAGNMGHRGQNTHRHSTPLCWLVLSRVSEA